MSEVTFRELASLDELKLAEDVQRQVWGNDDMPDNADLMLAIQQKIVPMLEELQAELKTVAEEEAKAAQARRDDDRSQAQTDAQAKREEAARAKREQEARAKRESELRAKREEAARARALLEGCGTPSADKPAAADAKGGRFIVQVGAFADDSAVREARQKAERAGVKTYTQTVETSAGKRTRVRAGPFSSREDADKAAGALKKAGLGGSVLSL